MILVKEDHVRSFQKRPVHVGRKDLCIQVFTPADKPGGAAGIQLILNHFKLMIQIEGDAGITDDVGVPLLDLCQNGGSVAVFVQLIEKICDFLIAIKPFAGSRDNHISSFRIGKQNVLYFFQLASRAAGSAAEFTYNHCFCSFPYASTMAACIIAPMARLFSSGQNSGLCRPGPMPVPR